MAGNGKQKLELDWIGKGEELRLEPRILVEDPNKSYGDPASENMLIHGDNLLALKALEQDFAGKIKCIYIDPPYNTGSAFEHYDDNLEHSTWLSLMKPRLELLKSLLHPTEGSIWISIDDDESHYLKVLCDEVFLRKNFVANMIWEKKYAPSNDAKWFSDSHDHILVYAKNKEVWRPNLLPRTEKQNTYYKYDDGDGRGSWRSDNMLVKTFSKSGVFAIVNPNTGKEYLPPEGSCYRFNQTTAERLLRENRLYFGKGGKGAPQLKRYLSEVKQGVTSLTIWFREDVGDNQEAKNEIKALFIEDQFGTPKPERLIKRIFDLASKPDDWTLDSFLGSGTAAAVAHKMGRKYIGIEFGEHANTHCLPRLKKVVDGTDGLALSETLEWKGGGGVKFYNLAPSLLKQDQLGNWIIDEKYNANMLAAAVCKHEGFKFQPHPEIYWKQGQSTEKDFIFVMTGHLTLEWFERIHEELGKDGTLLICAKSFASECDGRFPNITIKKIPQMVLGRCEFGAKNYDLKIISAVKEEAEEEVEGAVLAK